MFVYSFSDSKRSTDLMFMLGLKETIDQLAMANMFIGMVMYCGERMVMSSEGHWILRVEFKGRKVGQRVHGKSRLRNKV